MYLSNSALPAVATLTPQGAMPNNPRQDEEWLEAAEALAQLAALLHLLTGGRA